MGSLSLAWMDSFFFFFFFWARVWMDRFFFLWRVCGLLLLLLLGSLDLLSFVGRLTSAREWASVPRVGVSWALLPSTTRKGEPGARRAARGPETALTGWSAAPFYHHPVRTSGPTACAGAKHELGGGRKEGRRAQGSPFLFLFIGFV